MSVSRFTTPTFALILPNDANVDLTDADSVYVTFAFRGEIITKTGDDLVVEAKKVSVYLAQDETMKFPVGDVEIQLNWVIDDDRFASDIVKYTITDNLLQRVVS